MGSPAARLTDMHTCPMVTGVVPHVGGPITAPGCPTVLIGGMPAARVSDMAVCVGPPDSIIIGAFTVLIGGQPAARIGDMTAHGGVIILGCPTVLIGDSGAGAAATVTGAPGAGAGGGAADEDDSGGTGSATDPSATGTFLANADEAAIAAAKREAARLGIPFCEECMRARLKQEHGEA